MFELAICQPGEVVKLVREPRNQHDPRAIAVYSCRGIQLGYITAERAGRVGQLMQQDRADAIFQEKTNYGAVIRVAFGDDIAFLPPPRPKQSDDQEFWPDPEWPDE